jgi:flagellar hook-basal body complex protein FliE
MANIGAVGLPSQLAPRSITSADSAAPAAPSATGGPSFGDRIATALAEANRELVSAEDAAGQFARGEIGTLDAVVAMSKADLTLRHLVTLRNRALESLQEVLRLQL